MYTEFILKVLGTTLNFIFYKKKRLRIGRSNKRDERQAEQEIPVMKMSRGQKLNITLLYQNEYF